MTVTDNKVEIPADDLDSEAKYSFKVSASNDYMEGPKSEPQTFETKPSGIEIKLFFLFKYKKGTQSILKLQGIKKLVCRKKKFMIIFFNPKLMFNIHPYWIFKKYFSTVHVEHID